MGYARRNRVIGLLLFFIKKSARTSQDKSYSLRVLIQLEKLLIISVISSTIEQKNFPGQSAPMK